MSNTYLLTDVKSKETGDSIEVSEDALTAHATTPTSGVHGGFVAKVYSYQDSVGESVASLVLEISVPPEPPVYVPLQYSTVSAGSPDTSSNPGGVGFVSTPLVQNYPQGSYLSTDNVTFDDLNPDILGAKDKLLAHALKDLLSSHGGLTISDQDTFDNKGHRVGRKVVSIKVNGEILKMVADPSPHGPPQPPRGPTISHRKVESKLETGGFEFPPIKWVVDELFGDDDANQPPVDIVTATVTGGTEPIYWQWQWSINGTTWYDFVRGQVYDSRRGNFVFSSGNYPVSGQGKTSQFRPSINHTDEGREYPGFYYRCVFSNSAIGGGTVYTPYVEADLKFEEGCWICSQVNQIVPLTDEEKGLLHAFKMWCVKHYPKKSLFYLRQCSELTNRMSNAGFKWEYMVGFEKSLMHLVRGGHFDSAYLLYRDTVLDAVDTYWPECKHPAYKAMLRERTRYSGAELLLKIG